MRKTLGQCDPAAAFSLAHTCDDAGKRGQANRAVAVSAIGLGATGLVESLLAVLTGSVGLLGDAIHKPVGRLVAGRRGRHGRDPS